MVPVATCALAARLVLAAPAAPAPLDTLPSLPTPVVLSDSVIAVLAAAVVTAPAAAPSTAAPTPAAPAAPARRSAGPALAPVVAPVPAELAAPFAGRADSVVVEKGARRLTLYSRGRAVRSFLVALGADPVGAKRVQGDGRTPEGVYRIDYRNPQSRFHRALHVSYPNARDRAAAAKLGRSPGGDIMIHGLPPRSASVGAAHRTYDWTEGCVAVTNEEIEEIWRAVPDGTPIEIKP